MRARHAVLKVVALLIVGLAVVLLLPRRGAEAPVPVAPDLQTVTAPPVAAPVLISATALRIGADVELPGIDGESGVLDGSAGAAVQAALEGLTASGAAEILTSPRIMVLSGEPARIVVGSVPVPGASPPVKRSLEVDVLATAYADGSADLRATVIRKDVSGELSVFLDDLGLPIGERRADGDLRLPPGSRAYLARRLRDGTLLVVLLDPDVQLPEPAPAEPPGGG